MRKEKVGFGNLRVEKVDEYLFNTKAKTLMLFKGVKILFTKGMKLTINRKVKLLVTDVQFVKIDDLTNQDAIDYGFNFGDKSLEKLKDRLIRVFVSNQYTKYQKIRVQKIYN
mgnify:CR=1 FL=1